MKIFMIMVYLVMASFEISLLGNFGNNLLGKNDAGRKENSARYVLAVILMTSINNLGNTSLNLVGVPLVCLLFSLLQFRGHPTKKVIVTLCFYILLIGPEFIFAMMDGVNLNPDYSPEGFGSMRACFMLLIMKLMTFILVKVIVQIHSRRTDLRHIENNTFCMLLILPVATISCFMGIFYAGIPTEGKAEIFLLAGAFFLLFSNAFMFYLFEKLLAADEKARKMELLNMKSNMEKKHYLELEKANEKYKELLHDMRKYLRTAGQLVKNRDYRKALRVLARVGIRLNEEKADEYAVDKILNAILVERKSQAMMCGAEFRVSVDADVDVSFMDELDLIAILGNLIDNALEATEQVSGWRYVSIQIYMSNQCHFLSIEVKNNFSGIPLQAGDRFETTKRNKEEHGIGLRTVKILVQKYRGMMQTKIGGKDFTVNMVIPVPVE